MKKEETKKEGVLVGIDTGINACYTMSNNYPDQENRQSGKDVHGHDLHSITTKLARKKNGSKAFERAKEHQKNYIHWTINKINFDGVKSVNIEKISNYRKGKRTSRLLNFFPHRFVEECLKDKCKLQGVLVSDSSSAFRSQRCSKCGYVDPMNRKGKNFRCKHCSFHTDADCNASDNHEIELPSANFIRFLPRRPRKFFWKIEGFSDLDGLEFTVPDTKKYKFNNKSQ
jgi:transposase